MAEKDLLLLRAAHGEGALLGAELLQRFRRASAAAGAAAAGERTVVALLRAAAGLGEQRRRREARQEAEAAGRREREAAIALEQRLEALAPRVEEAWLHVDAHIRTKKPPDYAAAVRLLQDLQVLSARGQRGEAFAERVRQLRHTHARRGALLRQLDGAGL